MDSQAMRWRAALLPIAVSALLVAQPSPAAPSPPVAASHSAHVSHPARHHRVRKSRTLRHYHRAPPPQLVFRIDRVTAKIVRRKLVITADGAVSSGGWRNARLRAKPSLREAPVLRFDFLADPPPPGRVVIEELLPIRVTITRSLPRYGTVAIEVISSTNEITTQIARS